MSYDLDAPLFLDEVLAGDIVSPELARAYVSLLYFAAETTGAPLERLRLRDLVAHVQGRAPAVPGRRSSDAPLPLAHPSGCRCRPCLGRRALVKVVTP